VSVILPVYNGQMHVLDSIDCILKQTVEDFELIIINDGSTDKSKEIILSKKDNRISYIENKNNQGLIKTLNKGLYYAKGRYIARMDADDLCDRRRFEKQIDFFNLNKEIDILGITQYVINGNRIIPNTATWQENNIRLLLEPVVGHSSVMIKKESMGNNRLYYDKNALYAEDYKLWVDASLCGLRIANLQEALCGYRYHENQISNLKFYPQQLTANAIRLQYAKVYFNDLINSYEADYLCFITGRVPNKDSLSKLRDYEQLSEKMIEKNRKHQYFILDAFEKFLLNALNNISNRIKHQSESYEHRSKIEVPK
jgi:glycosyltransferase involved in cell wall biosynthesis